MHFNVEEDNITMEHDQEFKYKFKQDSSMVIMIIHITVEYSKDSIITAGYNLVIKLTMSHKSNFMLSINCNLGTTVEVEYILVFGLDIKFEGFIIIIAVILGIQNFIN